MSSDMNTAQMTSDSGLGSEAPQALLIRIGCSANTQAPTPLLVHLSDHASLQLGRGEADRQHLGATGGLELTLDDPSLSARHARILRLVSPEGWFYTLEDLESTNGCKINGVRVSAPRPLEHGDIIETGHIFWKFHYRPIEQLDRMLARAYPGGPITFSSSFSVDLLAAIVKLEQIAPSELPVIIRGESGTGKEGMASELHRASRRSGPFVALNCAAIPEGLIESELFGHRKGAFTGAVADKPGMIEAAHGGTLLLDEVGDMPPPLQAKLLRVLQERAYTRLGDPTVRKADVRFVAATHRALREMVEQGEFRGDLYARLNGLTIDLPPLRERKEDLGLLLTTFLKRSEATNKPVAHRLFRALTLYDWPFNIRELEKAIGVAVAFGVKDARLEQSHLPPEVRAGAQTPSGVVPAVPGDAEPPAARRKRKSRPPQEELVEALRQHRGNISAVARELETTRMQIHRWLKHYDVDPGAYREA
jgi:transcriptional regulator with AAA-type ATPase domain